MKKPRLGVVFLAVFLDASFVILLSSVALMTFTFLFLTVQV